VASESEKGPRRKKDVGGSSDWTSALWGEPKAEPFNDVRFIYENYTPPYLEKKKSDGKVAEEGKRRT